MKGSLEARVTKGGITFVRGIEYNPLQRTARFLTENDSGEICTLRFSDVTLFSDILHDPAERDPELIEQLIGPGERDECDVEDNNCRMNILRYVSETDDREMIIHTETPPRVVRPADGRSTDDHIPDAD